MTSLNNILKFYWYPRTVKVASGTITSEEGSEICPGDVITVYNGGIKVYISPEDIVKLKGNEKRNCFRAGDYGNTNTGDHIVKSIFVSNKEGLLDHHCQTKIYTNVSDLHKDQPPLVVANSDFMAFSTDEDKGMRKVKKDDKLQILYDDMSVKSQKPSVLKAKIHGDVIMLRDGNEQINVTASITDDRIYYSNDIVAGKVDLPRVMSFADKDTHGVFRSQTGYSRLVINDKFKSAFCLSKKIGKPIEQVSGDIGVIKNIRCFDVDMKDTQNVTVQVVKDSTMEDVTPKFAVDVGTDKEGFKLYDLYVQFKGKWKKGYSYIEVKPQIPTESPTSSDSDTDDDGSYEEPLPKHDTQPREDGIKTNGSPVLAEKHSALSSKLATVQPSENVVNREQSNTSSLLTLDVTDLPDDEGPKFSPLSKESSVKRGVPPPCQTENKPSTLPRGTILQSDQSSDDKLFTRVNSTSKPTTAVKPSPVSPTVLVKSDSSLGPPPLPPRSTTEHNSADGAAPDVGDGKIEEGSTIVLRDLSVSQLVDVLNEQNFKKLADLCKEHAIDGKFLKELTDEDLKAEPFNLNSFEIKKCNWLKEGNIPKV